jgi:arabinofuranosyltransferase
MKTIRALNGKLFPIDRRAALLTLVSAHLFGGCFFLLFYAFSWDFDAAPKALFVRLVPLALVGLALAAAVSVLSIASMSGRQERLSALAVFAISIAADGAFLKLAQLIFNFTIDDAFITFRYARNLASGAGPTFNAGQPHVEGYTTFLWMIVMAVPHLAGIDAVIFAKLLGLLLGIVTFVFVSLIVFELVGSDSPSHGLVFGSFSALLLATFYPTAVHAVSGMETMLFTALLSAAVYLALVSTKQESRVILLLPFVCLSLGLTRPEGNLINAILLAVAVWQCPSRFRNGFLVSCILLYLLPGSAYFYWRYSYYGLLFPLPFYMKLWQAQGLAGMPEVSQFLLTILPSLGLFLVLSPIKSGRAIWFVLAPTIVLLGFYLFPRPIMSFDWRFIYPSAPLIYALGGVGIFKLMVIIRESSWGARRSLGSGALLALGIGLVALNHLADVPAVIQEKNASARSMNAYRYLGKALKAFHADKPLTLAFGDAGAIPYYSEWQTLDMFGLNDPNVLLAPTLEASLDYIINKHPDLVIITFGDAEQPVRDNPSAETVYNAVLKAGMKKVGAYKVGNTYYLWLFTRPGSDLGSYLRQTVLKQGP